MSKLRNFKGILIILACAVLFYTQLPLGTALLFGEDEGCELMKAVMCNKGFHLYTDIWNDQPPLFTLFLCQAFKIFGTSVLAARLVAAFFGTLMFATFYWLVEQRLGFSKALLATFFLIAAPVVALISTSVMLEVPAFASALLASCLLFHWRNTTRTRWLVASGLVLGAALQIKLTAILFVPAMLGEIVFGCRPFASRPSWKPALVSIVKWGISATLAFLVIMSLWARGSLSIALKSHFTSLSLPGLNRAEDFPFQLNFLANHIECVAAAAIGVVLVIRQARWREALFPIILLATVAFVDAVHQPWWSYYYLHLAIPLAWLSALAVAQVIGLAGQLVTFSHYRLASAKTWQAVLLCALAGFILVRSEKRFESRFASLRNAPPAVADPVVAKMREYAGQTHWVYADQEIYPFHAGLATPPELTVVVFKRFWSGQITTADLVTACKNRGVEQLALDPAHLTREWSDFLTDYDAVYRNTNVVLFVAKRIENK